MGTEGSVEIHRCQMETGRKRGRIGEECMRVAEVGVGLSGELEKMGMSEGMRREWCREAA